MCKTDFRLKIKLADYEITPIKSANFGLSDWT